MPSPNIAETAANGAETLPTLGGPDKLDQGALALTQPEVLRDNEAILNGVVAVAETVVAKYAQVDSQGNLNYYFAGSLATMLLAQASSIEPLDTSALPSIRPATHIPVPPEAATTLQAMTRPIGDIDIAILAEYDEQAEAHTPAFDPTNPEPYKKARQDWIAYGVEATFPEAAEAAIKDSKADIVTGRDPARIVVRGQEFYIPDPKVMLEYKAVHLVEDFAGYADKRKLVDDFASLVEGLSLIYPREDLVRIIHDALGYDPNIVLPALNGAGRIFLEEAVATDENAGYLEHLHTEPERSMGMLNILRRYKTPEAKQAIVDFINKNWRQLDHWQVNTRDPGTFQAVVSYVRHNHADLKTKLEDYGVGMDNLEAWLRINTWAVAELSGEMPADSGLAYEPVYSDYLSLLAELDEPHMPQELSVLDKIVTVPPRFPEVPRGNEAMNIFKLAAASDPLTRRALFENIDLALTKLDPSTAQEFLKNLSSASRDIPLHAGPIPEEQLAAIRECFSAFSLPFHPTAT